MSKRKSKTLVEVFADEYKTDGYPSKFRKGTLGYVLDQEKGVEKVTVARKAQLLVASIRQAVEELSQREIVKRQHVAELDEVGRRLEIIVQEIDDG